MTASEGVRDIPLARPPEFRCRALDLVELRRRLRVFEAENKSLKCRRRENSERLRRSISRRLRAL